MQFTDLEIKGMTFENVYRGTYGEGYFGCNDAIVFVLDEENKYVLTHIQEDFEWVEIESIDGDLSDLIGEPLLIAEEAYEEGVLGLRGTYSFYKFATIKGYVTIRFLGDGDEFYSEEAELFKLPYTR